MPARRRSRRRGSPHLAAQRRPSPRLAPRAPPRASHWLRRAEGAGRRGRSAAPIGRQRRPLTGTPGFYRPRPSAGAERGRGAGCASAAGAQRSPPAPCLSDLTARGGAEPLPLHGPLGESHRRCRALRPGPRPNGRAAAAAASHPLPRAASSPRPAAGRACAHWLWALSLSPCRWRPERRLGGAAQRTCATAGPRSRRGGGGSTLFRSPFPPEGPRKGARRGADASCPGRQSGTAGAARLAYGPSTTAGRCCRRRAPARRVATGFKAAARKAPSAGRQRRPCPRDPARPSAEEGRSLGSAAQWPVPTAGQAREESRAREGGGAVGVSANCLTARGVTQQVSLAAVVPQPVGCFAAVTWARCRCDTDEVRGEECSAA